MRPQAFDPPPDRYDHPMLLQRIQQQFIDSADLKYQCAQSLAPVVEAGTMAVLVSVTGGGKVLACGNGASAAAAQHFAASFMGRYDRERPELAAFSLSADAAVLTGIANDFDARAVYARQVRALEEHLGVALFSKEGRGLKLTDAGIRLRDVCAEVFGRLRSTCTELQQGQADALHGTPWHSPPPKSMTHRQIGCRDW